MRGMDYSNGIVDGSVLGIQPFSLYQCHIRYVVRSFMTLGGEAALRSILD